MTKQESCDSDVKTVIMTNPIEDAMTLVEDKVREKYSEMMKTV